MTEKQRVLILTLTIFLIAFIPLWGKDSVITIGEDDHWSSCALENLSLVAGKRGFLDVTNSDNLPKPDRYSDLILSFDHQNDGDSTGHYTIDGPLKLSSAFESFGGAAAFFDGENSLLIKRKTDSLFSTGHLWGDFSLEFRLFPATLKEGSTIFLWKGLQMVGNQLIPQEIRCTVSNRRLVWDFENFFLYPDNRINRVTLTGDKLIPSQWSHHLLVFDSHTGLLEYRINNIPSDSTYTTKTGHETAEFNVPVIGNQQSFPIELGKNFSGLIDELRLTSRIINNPILSRYTPSGLLETNIIDMGIPGSTLLRIESEYNQPENTTVHFQYALSEKKSDLYGTEILWHDYLPSHEIDQTGRYMKVRVKLTAEPARDTAPVLTNLKINYQKASLPHPPTNPRISLKQGKLVLSWEKPIDPTISGYLVYFGESPGEYLSSGSPVDAGNTNSIVLDTLDLNKRYYIAITSYRSGDTRLESLFSREISYSP